MLEAQIKNLKSSTIKQHIITEGETMKEVRKAAYGNTQGSFGDRFGFGSRYRRSFPTGLDEGMSED